DRGQRLARFGGDRRAGRLLGKAVHLVEELTQVRLIVHNCSATPLTGVWASYARAVKIGLGLKTSAEGCRGRPAEAEREGDGRQSVQSLVTPGGERDEPLEARLVDLDVARCDREHPARPVGRRAIDQEG